MERVKNFMNSSMTWGGYLKIGVVSFVLGLVITGLTWIGLTAYEKAEDKKYEGIKGEKTC